MISPSSGPVFQEDPVNTAVNVFDPLYVVQYKVSERITLGIVYNLCYTQRDELVSAEHCSSKSPRASRFFFESSMTSSSDCSSEVEQT